MREKSIGSHLYCEIHKSFLKDEHSTIGFRVHGVSNQARYIIPFL